MQGSRLQIATNEMAMLSTLRLVVDGYNNNLQQQSSVNDFTTKILRCHHKLQTHWKRQQTTSHTSLIDAH